MNAPNRKATDIARLTSDFLKRLRALDGSKSDRERFRDFCEMAYCAMAKLTAAPERAEALEDRYMAIVGQYRNKDDIRAYPELLGMTCQAVQAGEDFLGPIACELGALDTRAGQFFTPPTVARAIAAINLQGVGPMIEAQGFVTVGEPAAGAGGLILAAADVIAGQGHDPGLSMLVHATDIAALPFHMCFIQLSARGIAARVKRGDALSLETFEGAWTPATLDFHAHHGRLFPEPEPSEDGRQEPGPSGPPVQLTLFGEGGS